MKVKITRSVFIDGATKKVGEVVEVEKNFAIELVAINAAEYIKQEEQKVVTSTNQDDDLFATLKAKAKSIGVKYTKNITFEELSTLVQTKEESIALDALKAKAGELKLDYDENVTFEVLTKLIEEAENK